VHRVAVDNRLTAEELAALVPGDSVTIEFVRDHAIDECLGDRLMSVD
jgi:hypothetical protein